MSLQGLGGSGNSVIVTAAEAGVLAVAKGQIASLEAMAKAIGRPPFLATKSYHDQWGPWLDAWNAYYNAGIAQLESEEARTRFIDAFRNALSAQNRVRLDEQGAYDVLLSVLEGSPLRTLEVIVGDPSAFRRDLTDAAGGLGFPWNVLAWVSEHPALAAGGALALMFAFRRR